MNKYAKKTTLTIIMIIALFFTFRFLGLFFIQKFSPILELTSENNKSDSGKAILGKDIPYFNLSSISGGRVRSSELVGTAMVFTFWSTWNTESVDQIKIIDDYLSKNISSQKQSLVKIIAINSQESAGVVSNFIRRGGYNLTVLVDPNGETSNTYGIQTLPTTFFINPDGSIAEIFVGTMNETMFGDKIDKIIK